LVILYTQTALLCFRIGKKCRVRRDGLGNPKEEGISRMGWMEH
jgi:hypothetical protein